MLKIYAIKDVKVSCFLTPFFSQNDVTAQRAVYQALLQGESQLNLFSADYELNVIGSFNPLTGEVTAEQPQFIISCYTLWNQCLNDAKKREKTVATPLPAMSEAENNAEGRVGSNLIPFNKS